jgi:flagellar hook-basal body complex protein FliE
MRITSLGQGIQPPIAPKSKAVEGNGDDFAKSLMDALKEVNQSQLDAKGLQDNLLAGQQVEPHELMIAMEKAGTAMQLTLQVRNKVLEAYQEISRMQI